jgi:hypothetical protein
VGYSWLRHRVVTPARPPAYVDWRAGTTTHCQSRLYPPQSGTMNLATGSISPHRMFPSIIFPPSNFNIYIKSVWELIFIISQKVNIWASRHLLSLCFWHYVWECAFFNYIFLLRAAYTWSTYIFNNRQERSNVQTRDGCVCNIDWCHLCLKTIYIIYLCHHFQSLYWLHSNCYFSFVFCV